MKHMLKNLRINTTYSVFQNVYHFCHSFSFLKFQVSLWCHFLQPKETFFMGRSIETNSLSFLYLRMSLFAFILLLFFFFVILYFIYFYFWLCWVFRLLCEGFLQLRQVGATLHRGARASHYRGLSLRSTSSRRAGSVVVAHGPSCSAACGIFPDQGSNPCPLPWQADSQPLCHQGSPAFILDRFFFYI